MKRLYVVFVVLFVFVLVIILIPAQVFAVFLDDYRIHLLGARGTVWNGSAELVVPAANLGRLEWSIAPAAIFEGRLKYDVKLQSSALQVAGILEKSLSQSSLSGQATIEPSIVNSVLLNYDIKVSGSFTLNGVELRLDGSNAIESLTGTVQWDGGTSRYLVGEETRTVNLPPIVAELSAHEGDAMLGAFDETSDMKLLSVRLEPDSGWIHIALTRQMLELAQMPWDTAASPESEVLKVSRQLIR